jgi:hypothetical protein
MPKRWLRLSFDLLQRSYDSIQAHPVRPFHQHNIPFANFFFQILNNFTTVSKLDYLTFAEPG